LITRRLKIYFVFGLALVLVILSTTGCATGSASLMTGSSWPGITVFDGSAYLAFSSKVYAFDSETGAVSWSFPEKAAGGQTFFAPPAVTDDLVVVTDYSDSLFALNPADGKQLWTFKSNRSRFIGGAVIDENLVYASTVDGIIHALDRKKGSEEWSYTAEGNVWSTPLLADGTLYVTALDRHLYALDAQTGRLSWKFPDNGSNPPLGAMVSTPTLYEGVLYFGNFNNRLYALSVETHDVLWTHDTSNWIWSSPAIDEKNQRLISADLDGHVFALDLADGSLAWTYEATGAVVGAPLLGEIDDVPVVYLTCKGDPNLLVLNTSDGKETLRPVSLKADFTTKFLFIDTGTDTRTIPIFSPPVAADDLLLIGAHEGNDTLYALDRQDFQVAWRFNPIEYENKQKEEQGQAPESFFSNPLNLVLLMAMSLLMFSIMGRGRRK
jgi:outer membrane protein assembly factor BamB